MHVVIGNAEMQKPESHGFTAGLACGVFPLVQPIFEIFLNCFDGMVWRSKSDLSWVINT